MNTPALGAIRYGLITEKASETASRGRQNAQTPHAAQETSVAWLRAGPDRYPLDHRRASCDARARQPRSRFPAGNDAADMPDLGVPEPFPHLATDDVTALIDTWHDLRRAAADAEASE